jgi:hypothetical protein
MGWVVAENGDLVLPDGRWAGSIMVHADGDPCHGTPLRVHRDGGKYCPKCGIAPDMQSCEFWGPDEVKR